MKWQERLGVFGYVSVSRHDNPAKDAAIEGVLTAYAKLHKLQFYKGLMCFSLGPLHAATEWTDEKLTGKKKRR